MGALLALIATVLFVVAGFDGDDIDLVPIGLAFLSGAHVMGSWWPGGNPPWIRS